MTKIYLCKYIYTYTNGTSIIKQELAANLGGSLVNPKKAHAFSAKRAHDKKTETGF